MTDSQKNSAESGNDREKTVEFNFDGNLGNSLQAGLGALQQVFSGFVKMAQNTIGPDLVKNIQAGAWLGTVADCLEAIVSENKVTGIQAGELSCYAERLEEELAGSKFASQATSFAKRISAAVAAAERATQSQGLLSPEDVASVAAAAGYFRASAKSVISVSGGPESRPTPADRSSDE